MVMKNEIGKISLLIWKDVSISYWVKKENSIYSMIPFCSNTYMHIYVYTHTHVCVYLCMYLCIVNVMKGICQNIISDYLWVVDFMGDVILVFCIF